MPAKGPYDKGFTLIELLIVIVIIGIISSVTIFALGDFGRSRQATVAAEEFMTYVDLLEQRAILETSTVGITITATGYETYYYDAQNHWSPLRQKSAFHKQLFPKEVRVQLQFPRTSPNKSPDIMISSSGELTPFLLQFGTYEQPNLIQLIGKHNGALRLNKAATPSETQ